jgi:hypothetical protein
VQQAKATESDALGRKTEESVVDYFLFLSQHLRAEIKEEH